jgi:hypothetical protein
VLRMEDFYLYILCHAEKRKMEREVKELHGMAETVRVDLFHSSTMRKSFDCILMNVGLLMIQIQTFLLPNSVISGPNCPLSSLSFAANW